MQVELPLGATEDRICGTIDVEKALQEGVKAYEPGLLVSFSPIGSLSFSDHLLLYSASKPDKKIYYVSSSSRAMLIECSTGDKISAIHFKLAFAF